MNIVSKSSLSVFAFVALAVPAMAATISPANTDVTASGILTQGLKNFPFLTTQCAVTIYGTTDAEGITFTSMTGENVNGGPLSCNDGLVFPLRVEATSATSVTIKDMTVSTRIGRCGPQDVVVDWDNDSSTAGPVDASINFCEVTGSLTVSPAISIN